MMDASALLLATLWLPLCLLAACVSARLRARIPTLLAWAPVPALATALRTLALDPPGALLLGAAAVLWIAAGAHAAIDLRARPARARFAVWWLLALTGNLGVFLAADLASFYLFFALGSLSAYGLVAHDGSPRARRAGGVYVGFALLGEAALLLGFVLLASAAPGDSLSIRDAVAAISASPWRNATLGLLIAGFGIKIGLVPLYLWMPLAYSAAPFPAAAVMSGAAVKAGVIGLIRFLPMDSPQPDWGLALAAAGFVSAFFGVAVGVAQANPKTVLAYSSVSQMGLLAAVFGMGLANGDAGAALAASFYAMHHVLVKGGLFLALGVAATAGARASWPVRLPAAVVALGLCGLPFTGGALAKWVVKAPLGGGVAGWLAALSAAGSTLLMLHFLRLLAKTPASDAEQATPAWRSLPWLASALAAVALPFALIPVVAPVDWRALFAASELWASLWPMVLGGVMAVALWRRWPVLASVSAGDRGVVAERAARAIRGLGEAVERADGRLREWPAAGVCLLAVAILLGALSWAF